MKFGQRIELLKKLARTLSARDWTDIQLILNQSGLGTPYRQDRGSYSYCLDILGMASDDKLTELDDYLHSPSDASVDDAPWQTDDFHLFISHVSAIKGYAALLKARLEWYGIEGFVAHEDIEPNKEWQQVVEAGLRSCDACVALLHKGFPESKWCDQEIGFVVCRNVPVIPVHIDLQPYGFLGKIQSLHATKVSAFDLAPRVARSLVRDPRTGDALTERMVQALMQARSFDHANSLSGMMATDAPHVTADQLATMRIAQEANGQVGNAWFVEQNLLAIEKKFNITATSVAAGAAPAGYDPAEEPF